MVIHSGFLPGESPWTEEAHGVAKLDTTQHAHMQALILPPALYHVDFSEYMLTGERA